MNYIYVLLASILFSSMEVAIKLTGGVFNPLQLNFLRFLIGSIILYPISKNSLKKSNYSLKKKDYLSFAFTGFLCVVVAMSLYTLSVYFLEAHVAGILFCTNTFFAIIISHFFTNEKINKNTFIGIVLALLAIIVLVNPLDFKGSFKGVLISLSSALGFALYSFVSKRITKKSPIKAPTITCYTFLFGILELLILIGLSRISSVSNFFTNLGLDAFANIPIIKGLSRDNLLVFLYISFFVTGCGFASHLLAVEKNPVAISSLVFFLKPMLASFLSLLILKNPITGNQKIGILLISIASAIIVIERARTQSNRKIIKNNTY